MLVLKLFRTQVFVILILHVLTKRMVEDSSCIEKQTADVSTKQQAPSRVNKVVSSFCRQIIKPCVSHTIS